MGKPIDYNSIKIRSARWPNGHLKANFYVSTPLAAKIIELIALNEKTHHVVQELPKPARDKKGRFSKASAGIGGES